MTNLRDELLAIDAEAAETAKIGSQQMHQTKLDDDIELDERRAVEGYGLPLVCPGCEVGLPDGTERCPKCGMLIRPEHHQVPDRVRTLKEAVLRIRDEIPTQDKRYKDMAIGGAKGGKKSRSPKLNAIYNAAARADKASKEPRE